jgi:hypothetical protein
MDVEIQFDASKSPDRHHAPMQDQKQQQPLPSLVSAAASAAAQTHNHSAAEDVAMNDRPTQFNPTPAPLSLPTSTTHHIPTSAAVTSPPPSTAASTPFPAAAAAAAMSDTKMAVDPKRELITEKAKTEFKELCTSLLRKKMAYELIPGSGKPSPSSSPRPSPQSWSVR